MNLQSRIFAAAALLLAPLAGAGQGKSEQAMSLERTRSQTVTATVQKVDLDTRMVTLKGPKGKIVTLHADEKVKNLPQVKVGDIVTADYFESVAVYVTKPDGEQPMAGASAGLTTAKPGEKPGGVADSYVTIVATVASIAPDKTSVTLKGMDGNLRTIDVKNPENLTGVSVGDKVTIYVSEALAVSVAPAKAKKKAKGY